MATTLPFCNRVLGPVVALATELMDYYSNSLVYSSSRKAGEAEGQRIPAAAPSNSPLGASADGKF